MCSGNCNNKCNQCDPCNKCNPCDPCKENVCECPIELSSACVRVEREFGCIGTYPGQSLEEVLEAIEDKVCNVSDGIDGQDIDHVSFTSSSLGGGAGQPGATDTYTVWGDFDEVINLGTFIVYNGTTGPQGDPGLDGRGIAVFVQLAEPTQTDFDNQYGGINGFGVNNLPGSDTIKPGDLWIEPCEE